MASVKTSTTILTTSTGQNKIGNEKLNPIFTDIHQTLHNMIKKINEFLPEDLDIIMLIKFYSFIPKHDETLTKALVPIISEYEEIIEEEDEESLLDDETVYDNIKKGSSAKMNDMALRLFNKIKFLFRKKFVDDDKKFVWICLNQILNQVREYTKHTCGDIADQ